MDKKSEKTRRMSASLVTAVAAMVTLGGCGSETGRCVDASGRVLPDAACTGGGGGGGVYYSRGYSYPHWVYGGSVSGGRVVGYSTSPSGGRVVSPGGTVVRGGFGGFGEGGGHGGGGGE